MLLSGHLTTGIKLEPHRSVELQRVLKHGASTESQLQHLDGCQPHFSTPLKPLRENGRRVQTCGETHLHGKSIQQIQQPQIKQTKARVTSLLSLCAGITLRSSAPHLPVELETGDRLPTQHETSMTTAICSFHMLSPFGLLPSVLMLCVLKILE